MRETYACADCGQPTGGPPVATRTDRAPLCTPCAALHDTTLPHAPETDHG